MRLTQGLDYHKIERDSAFFDRGYRFWKSSWEETLAELGAHDHLPLFSDAYIYRDRHLFVCDEQPAALFLTETIGPEGAWRDHSYFQMYSGSTVQDLVSQHRKMVSVSFIAIAEEWRKSRTDISILDLVFGLSIREWRNSDADALISCVRKNRKVDASFAQFGARSVGQGHAFHVDVEYMLLERGAARPHPDPRVELELKRLWTQSKGVDDEGPTSKRRPTDVPNIHEYAMGK